MIKIKDILKDRTCNKCDNSEAKNFILYFVLEEKKITNYISCLICGETVEVKMREAKVEDYMLEPNFGMGG